MIRIVRGIISRVIGAVGKLPRVDVRGLPGETIDSVELFSQYGVSSSPRSGAECVSIKINGQYVTIATADRRCVFSLNTGDVALHTGDEEYVKVLGVGGIEIKSTKTINIVSDSEVNIRGTAINLGSGAGLDALIDTRIVTWLNSHTHPVAGAVASMTSTPIINAASYSTAVVKGS